MNKNITSILSLSSSLYKMLPTRYIKRYKRKYLGWLQWETRKLHKISEDKNLTESVHRKISHGVQNSLAASCGFVWCTKFHTAMRKFKRGAAARLSERQFRTLCEISHTMRNHKRQPKNFAHHAKSSCAPTPLDFYLQTFCVIS